MPREIVLDNVKPSSLTVTESYHYHIDLSANTDIRSSEAPKGEIGLNFPLDGKDYFPRTANDQLKKHRNRTNSNESIVATVGRLKVENHNNTDLDSKFDMRSSGDTGFSKVQIPISNPTLRASDSLISGIYETKLSASYNPETPNLYPISISPTIVDSTSLNDYPLWLHDSNHASILNSLRDPSGWLTVPFVMKLSVTLLLSGHTDRDGPKKLKVKTTIGLHWELNQSLDDIQFHTLNYEIEKPKQNTVPIPKPIDSTYFPEKGILEAEFNEILSGQWEDSLEAMAYNLPEIWLYVNRPSLFNHSSVRTGTLRLELDGITYSRTSASFMHVLSEPENQKYYKNTTEKDDKLKLVLGSSSKSIIDADLTISFSDIFEVRQHSLTEELFFSGLILDENIVQQVSIAFSDHGFQQDFSKQVDSTGNTVESKEQGIIRFLLSFKKTEGTNHLHVWVLLEGSAHQVERTFGDLGDQGIQTKSIVDAGDTRLIMKGRLRREQKVLVDTFSSIVDRLKGHFRHLEVQR